MTFLSSFFSNTLPIMAACAVLSNAVCATELVYTPVNPTFGGNPNNAPGLLAIANAQNNHKAPTTPTTPKTALERFNEHLEAAILSRLTTNTVSELFAKDGKLLPGQTVSAGNYLISVNLDEATGVLSITTADKTTPNSKTTIVVGSASSSLE